MHTITQTLNSLSIQNQRPSPISIARPFSVLPPHPSYIPPYASLMAAPPVLSRSTSSSWTDSSEPKAPFKDAPGLVESLEAADKKPLWKRLLSGNAVHEYDTQRGMSERHVMMIGKRKDTLSLSQYTTDSPSEIQPSEGRLGRVSS